MAMHLKRMCEQGKVAAAAFVFAASLSGGVFGAEGGGSSYLQGTYGDFAAAVAPAPGGYLRNDVIYHDAGIGPRPINGGFDSGFDQKLWMDRLTMAFFTDAGASGASFGIEVQIPYVFDLTVGQRPGGPAFDSFDSPRDQAMGDPVIKPQLAWGSGPHHTRLSLGIVAPWGTVDESSMLSVGRDYWSFDPSVSYTYLGDSGWDLSATAGVMFNLDHSLTGPNYKTGDEAHIDALFGKHFGDSFALGIAGYWYGQLNADDGPIPAQLGLRVQE